MSKLQHENTHSYQLLALVLCVLFAVPIVLFLGSGLSINISDYAVSEQIEIPSVLGIPDDILETLDIQPYQQVTVTPSLYTTAMQITTGLIPLGFVFLIIISPLAECIYYFRYWKHGHSYPLAVEESLLTIVIIPIVSGIGTALAVSVGMAATYNQGLSYDEVVNAIGQIMGFGNTILIGLAIYLVLFFIPILSKLFIKPKPKNLLEADELEFLNDEKISEE